MIKPNDIFPKDNINHLHPPLSSLVIANILTTNKPTFLGRYLFWTVLYRFTIRLCVSRSVLVVIWAHQLFRSFGGFIFSTVFVVMYSLAGWTRVTSWGGLLTSLLSFRSRWCCLWVSTSWTASTAPSSGPTFSLSGIRLCSPSTAVISLFIKNVSIAMNWMPCAWVPTSWID